MSRTSVVPSAVPSLRHSSSPCIGVVGGEIEDAVDTVERGRKRPLAVATDVAHQARAVFGAVARPQLGAVGAVVGAEEDAAVHRHEVVRIGADDAGLDVAHLRRAGGRAVAAPQLDAGDDVVGREQHPVAERGQPEALLANAAEAVQQDGARCGAVGLPQADPGGGRVGDEEHLVTGGDELARRGRRHQRHHVDVGDRTEAPAGSAPVATARRRTSERNTRSNLGNAPRSCQCGTTDYADETDSTGIRGCSGAGARPFLEGAVPADDVRELRVDRERRRTAANSSAASNVQSAIVGRAPADERLRRRSRSSRTFRLTPSRVRPFSAASADCFTRSAMKG